MAGDDQTLAITGDQIRDARTRIENLWSEDPEAAESLRKETILRVLYTIAKRRTTSPSLLAAEARGLYEQ